MRFRFFVNPIWENLSLGELGSTTSCLETVLLSFLHTRVSGEEAGLLEKRTIGFVSEKKSAGYTVTDCTCLAGDTAAANVCNDVKLAGGFGYAEGLVDDELEGFKSEVIVDITTVDGDVAGAGVDTNASYRALSSAGTIEIRLCTSIQ